MKSVMSIYIILLGIALGVELCVGAFVAPVIFFPARYLGEGVLSHFQSGVLMTQVFLKSNMLLGFVAFYSMVFEMLTLIKNQNKDNIALMLSFVIFALTASFLFYYTPFIVDAQKAGALATASEAFAKMHKESEWVMKFLMIVQITLIFRRVGLLGQKA